jgi:AcrR family transcriptional regulator
MARPTKSEQIPNLSEAIKNTAWKQTAEFGASALSLRAIARELKITAPAIYNYFPSRDDLVSALIVDAFTSLGNAQRRTLKKARGKDSATRLSALELAYRDWAVTYPQRYQLIFGSPLPNYDASVYITLPATARALVSLIETVQAIFVEGRLKVERLTTISANLKKMLEQWREVVDQGIDVEVLYLTLVIWSRLHGLVALELGHQIPSYITDPAEIFHREIENIRLQYVD